VANSKGTNFKKLIGSATDFGTINSVFRLRPAINLKSLRFGVEFILETQTKTMKITFLVVKHSLDNVNGDYLSRGQSTAAATTNNGYYLSRGQMKNKTKTKINALLVNEGALARIRNISSEGDVLANEGATSSTFILTQLVYHHLTQPTYQEQIQHTKSNIPTSTNKIPTHQKKKGFLRTAPTTIQSSVHLRGSVRISHSVVSCVYKMLYILSLLRFGTSTISTKFHQALQIQIGF
jgi:hypothetical protein